MSKTDGKTYSTNNTVFTDAGEYTVCYKIEKSNYDTVTGKKKVVIAKKDLEVKADDQRIVWGNDIDNTKYNVSGLTEGDGISEIICTVSFSVRTEVTFVKDGLVTSTLILCGLPSYVPL